MRAHLPLVSCLGSSQPQSYPELLSQVLFLGGVLYCLETRHFITIDSLSLLALSVSLFANPTSSQSPMPSKDGLKTF